MTKANNEISKTQIIDIQSGEVTEIILSEEILLERQQSIQEFAETMQAVTNARASAFAKLAELGLTEEEIAAL
jgi:hypothetical protein